jgi:hypothetical protein
MNRWQRYNTLAAVVILAILGGGFAYWHHTNYPYGVSHCCAKQISTALKMYALDHGGRYPAGESSPEASLSLLYPKYLSSPEPLRGKTVPAAIVNQRLKNGQLLTPETCGWHYVEGLSENSDPKLLLIWDKVGLAHNGQRLPDGGHEVVFVDHSAKQLSGAEWRAALAEQEKLSAAGSK